MKFIYTFFCDHGGDKAGVFMQNRKNQKCLYIKGYKLFVSVPIRNNSYKYTKSVAKV